MSFLDDAMAIAFKFPLSASPFLPDLGARRDFAGSSGTEAPTHDYDTCATCRDGLMCAGAIAGGPSDPPDSYHRQRDGEIADSYR